MAKTTIAIKGNLGKDGELKVSKSGKSYSVFSVASTPSKKNAAGEWENGETMWFNITSFEIDDPSLYHKGDSVEVFGSFTVRNYKKADGSPAYSLDVVANKIEILTRSTEQKSGYQERTPLEVPASWSEIQDDLPF